MLRARNSPVFGDGVVTICREKDRKTDFNARRNVTALSDMDQVVKLAFGESSKRQQDLEFAEQSGFSLSYKVRTRYYRGVDSKLKAVINGDLYDIRYVDKSGCEMFLFLEYVKPLEVVADA